MIEHGDFRDGRNKRIARAHSNSGFGGNLSFKMIVDIQIPPKKLFT